MEGTDGVVHLAARNHVLKETEKILFPHIGG